MSGSAPMRDSRVMKDDLFHSIETRHAGFPAGRIVTGAHAWQIRVVDRASRDARDHSASAAPRRLSRKAAAGWLAAALLFTGATSPSPHAAASHPPKDGAPKMFPG